MLYFYLIYVSCLLDSILSKLWWIEYRWYNLRFCIKYTYYMQTISIILNFNCLRNIIVTPVTLTISLNEFENICFLNFIGQ